MLHINGIVEMKFQISIFYRSREKKIKADKKLLINSTTGIDVLHIDGNVDKKYQPSIFYRVEKITFPPIH